ncbi:hypothetical protein ACVWWN_000052 [Mycobacterium sp. URHB0021]
MRCHGGSAPTAPPSCCVGSMSPRAAISTSTSWSSWLLMSATSTPPRFAMPRKSSFRCWPATACAWCKPAAPDATPLPQAKASASSATPLSRFACALEELPGELVTGADGITRVWRHHRGEVEPLGRAFSCRGTQRRGSGQTAVRLRSDVRSRDRRITGPDMKTPIPGFSHIRALVEKDTPRKATEHCTGSKHFSFSLKVSPIEEVNVSPGPCTTDHSRPAERVEKPKKMSTGQQPQK